jgi:hypothetical protein
MLYIMMEDLKELKFIILSNTVHQLVFSYFGLIAFKLMAGLILKEAVLSSFLPPHTSSWHSALLVKHGDNFTFYFLEFVFKPQSIWSPG